MKKRGGGAPAPVAVEFVFAAVPTGVEFRAFLYGIFMEDLALRRVILKHWHSPYAPEPDTVAGPAKRIADLWTRFIRDLVYEKVRFCMTPEYFLLWGNGTRSLRVEYAWLRPEQKQFLIWRVYAHRETLFKSIKVGLNGEFFADGFVYDEQCYSYIWQREIVRDFVWYVANKKSGTFNAELICALQSLLYEHPRGKCDIFLLNLHDALQGKCLLEEAPCWGITHWDLHPEERVELIERIKRERVFH